MGILHLTLACKLAEQSGSEELHEYNHMPTQELCNTYIIPVLGSVTDHDYISEITQKRHECYTR